MKSGCQRVSNIIVRMFDLRDISTNAEDTILTDWNILPWKVVESLSLEVLKERVEVVLSDMV